MSCFGDASLCIHESVTTRPRLPRCGRVDAIDATETAQNIELTRGDGVSVTDTASGHGHGEVVGAGPPGTGMGTGASRNAAPADASLPTSMTNNFAGWPSFFS